MVNGLRLLGFTAGDTTRQRDPGNVEEGDFDAFWDKHTREHPPPHGKGMLAVESAGYACGRGAAWISYDCGTKAAAMAALKARQVGPRGRGRHRYDHRHY